MIPLRDNIRSHRFPLVTLALVVANCVVFYYELRLGSRLSLVLLDWGIVPVRYTIPDVARLYSIPEQVGALFTSMFLHAGWVHLLGNLWVLWLFGNNVEARLGSGRFLLLYFGSGLAAAALHIYSLPHSTDATIGASGAVAGVMGAYFRYFPRARVATVVPPLIFGPIFELPALLFLGLWFLLQFGNGLLTLSGSGQSVGGIAWWAHVGGFAFGVLFALLVRSRPRRGSGQRLAVQTPNAHGTTDFQI